MGIITDQKQKATRAAFGESLLELGKLDEDIVVLDADLSKSTQSMHFAKEFPDRFFEMGIAEANMIGTATGLALTGKKPYICSFSVFVTGRYDIIRMSIAFNQANVKIVGTHCGVGVGEDGNSQQGIEDINIMRGLPNLEIYQPADFVETKALMKYLVKSEKPAFLRLTRQAVPAIHKDESYFKVGKAEIICQGKDVVIIASGATVSGAIEACQLLEKENISAGVVNIHSIKPIDKETIVSLASKYKTIFTVEDHSIIGGLGSAVCEVTSELAPTKVIRLGIEDRFGESGTPAELYHYFKLNGIGIAESVKNKFKKS